MQRPDHRPEKLLTDNKASQTAKYKGENFLGMVFTMTTGEAFEAT